MVTLDGSAMGFDYSAFLSKATNNATLTTDGLLDTSAVRRALASDCGPDGNGTTCLNIFGGQGADSSYLGNGLWGGSGSITPAMADAITFQGKNTGGMGAYSPSGLINKELDLKIIETVIKPTFQAIKDMDETYKGFLYVGLMIRDNNPYLVEYNVRMGDPECQTILPTLSTDLLDILISCCDGTLNQTNINFSRSKSICVVLCSKGYPDKFENNIEIKNLEQLKLLENQNIFHAGTLKTETNITVSNGGRVLNFVSTSDDFSKCREEAINLIKKLNWENGYFRRDIGHNVIKK